MKSLHIIPEIPAVVIYDREKHTTDTFEVGLQNLYDLRLMIGDALAKNFPGAKFPDEKDSA